jgi:membrane associated rhomboid family serine protease
VKPHDDRPDISGSNSPYSTKSNVPANGGATFLNVPDIVKVSVAVLVVIHLLVYWSNTGIQAYVIYGYSFIPARFSSIVNVPQLPGARYWSALTYSLLHGNAMHLIFNSLWLLVFGTPVARRLSPFKFLLVAAAGSIGGALSTLLFHWNEVVILVGASAAVSALMAAAVPIMFGSGSMLRRMGTEERAREARVLPFGELIQHRQAMTFMAMFLGLTLFTGAAQLISSTALIQESNIAWEAHIGGFMFGLIAFYALDKGPVHGAG